jgi:hypothetical protein
MTSTEAIINRKRKNKKALENHINQKVEIVAIQVVCFFEYF